MIRTKLVEGRPDLICTYSDEGYMIKQAETEILYNQAIDPMDSGRAYTETDIKIMQPEDPEENDIDHEPMIDNISNEDSVEDETIAVDDLIAVE